MPCRFAVLVVLASLVAHPVFAQPTSQRYASAGMMAVIGERPMPYLSGGGEQVYGRVSIGGDVGLLFLDEPDGPRERNSFLTIVSVTGAHRPAPRTWPLQPFLSAGASLVGAELGWHVGGGANYWWNARVGLRVDLRAIAPFGGEGGLLVARMGVAFRKDDGGPRPTPVREQLRGR